MAYRFQNEFPPALKPIVPVSSFARALRGVFTMHDARPLAVRGELFSTRVAGRACLDSNRVASSEQLHQPDDPRSSASRDRLPDPQAGALACGARACSDPWAVRRDAACHRRYPARGLLPRAARRGLESRSALTLLCPRTALRSHEAVLPTLSGHHVTRLRGLWAAYASNRRRWRLALRSRKGDSHPRMRSPPPASPAAGRRKAR